MIGMNDDTRFLTDNRHDQLLAEAATRRLVTDEAMDGTTRTGTMGRLRERLFGPRERAVAVVRPTVARGEHVTPGRALAAEDRPRSVSPACDGSHVHERAAA